MVTAVKGVLIKCDVPTKVFIQHLDDSRVSGEKLIIDKPGFDDQTLFVYAKYLDFIKEELKKHKLTITYQPPLERKL